MKTRLIRDEPHFLATGSNFWIRTFLPADFSFRSLLSEDLEEERLGRMLEGMVE